MQSGRLSERLILQRRDTALSSSGSGAELEQFVDHVTVWAQVDPTGGSEGVAAAQRFAEGSIRARIRFRGDVLPTWRLKWRGQAYDITAVIPGGQQLREYEDLIASASPAENPET